MTGSTVHTDHVPPAEEHTDPSSANTLVTIIGAPVADGRYIDSEFPPCLSSIAKGDDKGENLMCGRVTWHRCSDSATALFNGMNPNNLMHAASGNPWLLAGVAALAEFPHRLWSFFDTDELDLSGQYRVKIFDTERRAWCKVTVDDFVPRICDVHGAASPHLGVRPPDSECWALILEKACAKWLGSYSRALGRSSDPCPEALLLLTNCSACRAFERKPRASAVTPDAMGGFGEKAFRPRALLPDYIFKEVKVRPVPDGHQFEDVAFDEVTSDDVLRDMLRADEQNYLMVAWGTDCERCDFGTSSLNVSTDPEAETSSMRWRPAKGYSYAVVGVETCGAEGQHYVQVRDPWHAGGRSQDTDLSSLLGIMDWDWLDGIVILPWEEFLEVFSTIAIAWVMETSEKYGKAQLRKSKMLSGSQFELSTDLEETGTLNESRDLNSPFVDCVAPGYLRGDIPDLGDLRSPPSAPRTPPAGALRPDPGFEHRTHSKSSNASVSSADTVLMEGASARMSSLNFSGASFTFPGASSLSVVQEGDNESLDPSMITSSSIRTRAQSRASKSPTRTSRSPKRSIKSPTRGVKSPRKQQDSDARRLQVMELAADVRAKVGRRSLINQVAQQLIMNDKDESR